MSTWKQEVSLEVMGGLLMIPTHMTSAQNRWWLSAFNTALLITSDKTNWGNWIAGTQDASRAMTTINQKLE